MTVSSYYPPQRVLMGPGPSDVSPRVLGAMARPTLGHLDPDFIGLMDSLREHLQYAFQTKNEITLALPGPGTLGMEACLVNLVEPGDPVVVMRGGYFSGRLAEIAERCDARVIVVDEEWGKPNDPVKLEAALAANPGVKLVAFVHGETSTGVLSDAAALAAVAHRHGALVMVDCVASLAGSPVLVDEWNLDAAFAASQKCLSGPAGLAPATVNPRAMDRIRGRRTPVRSWIMDLTLMTSYWGKGQRRTYHHTAPINNLYGLHEALVMLREEGLENAWERHRRHHRALRAGLEAMGLTYIAADPERFPQLNAVRIPAGVDDLAVRRRLLEGFGIEIGGGLGPLAGKIWRVGIMGTCASSRHVLLCLSALGTVLHDAGAPMESGAGTKAAEAVLAG